MNLNSQMFIDWRSPVIVEFNYTSQKYSLQRTNIVQ